MLQRISRLFVIKTRAEAWLVIYAIAVGAVERGRHYLEVYPGGAGWMLALACTGVVFLAGAKLLDSVRPVPVPAAAARRAPPARRGQAISRSRLRQRPVRRGSQAAMSTRND